MHNCTRACGYAARIASGNPVNSLTQSDGVAVLGTASDDEDDGSGEYPVNFTPGSQPTSVTIGVLDLADGALTIAGLLNAQVARQALGFLDLISGGTFSGSLTMTNGTDQVRKPTTVGTFIFSGGRVAQWVGADLRVPTSFQWTGGLLNPDVEGPRVLIGGTASIEPGTNALVTRSTLRFEAGSTGTVSSNQGNLLVTFNGSARVYTEPGATLTFEATNSIRFAQQQGLQTDRNTFRGTTYIAGGNTTTLGRTSNQGELTIKDFSTLSLENSIIAVPAYEQTDLSPSVTSIENGSKLDCTAQLNNGGINIAWGVLRSLYRADADNQIANIVGNLTLKNCQVYIDQPADSTQTIGGLYVDGTILWDRGTTLNIKVDATLGFADQLRATGRITVIGGGGSQVEADPFTHWVGDIPPFLLPPGTDSLFLKSGEGISGPMPPDGPNYAVTDQGMGPNATMWYLRRL